MCLRLPLAADLSASSELGAPTYLKKARALPGAGSRSAAYLMILAAAISPSNGGGSG